ncbi:MAG: hypothetical protein WCP45_11675, partial [Verrucomicrobiota bacterium]
VLDWWAGQTALQAGTKDGWLAGAKMFWLMPAGIAIAVAVVFGIAFRDRGTDHGQAPDAGK